MKVIFRPLLMILLLYVVQFLVFPALFPNFYPTSNNASGIFFLSALILFLLSNFLFEIKWVWWIVCDVFYFALIMIYSGYGAYGIGITGMNLDGMTASYSRPDVVFGAIVATIIVVVIQSISLFVSKLFRRLKNKKA